MDRAFERSVLSLAGRNADGARDGALARFLRNDVDGVPGVSQADIEALEQRRLAAQRAQLVQQILVFDLDGDLQVTSEELRERLLPDARKPLRSGPTSLLPTEEQVEEILAVLVAERMTYDRDGDGIMTSGEIAAGVAAEVEANVRQNRLAMWPGFAADTNADGIVSEDEFLARFDAVFAQVDANGDGQIDRDERTRAMVSQHLNDSTRARPGVMRAGKREETVPTFNMARSGCRMPGVPDGAEVAVIGGYEGAAMSDVTFGGKPDAVELFDVTVAADGPPIYVISPMFGATILRLTDPGARVKTVVSTRGEVAVIGGAPDLKRHKVNEQCHLSIHEPVAPDNPDPAAFYASVLGQPVAKVIAGYTLGDVTYSTGENTTTGVLTGALAPRYAGAARTAWDHFLRFNPGGLVPVDPATVKVSSAVKKHDLAPQQAGIAELLDDGALVLLPARNDVTGKTVFEDDLGRIRIGNQTFIPGSGDDLIRMGNLYYTEERPKTWVGRERVTLMATRSFTFPAGLSGAHSVRIALPSGVDAPVGDRGASEVVTMRN